MPCEVAENALLGRTVKVDDDIAAEDSIVLFGNTVIGVHEIESAKLDGAAQLGDYAHFVDARVAAAEEMLSSERQRYGSHDVIRVNAPIGFREDS
jgi:hypothetical protein